MKVEYILLKSLIRNLFTKKKNKDEGKKMTTLPLYRHQEDCLLAIRNFYLDEKKVSSRVVIPTGGGKSRIESLVIDEFGIKKENNVGASLVLFHRIALGQQHVGLGSSIQEKKGFREWIGIDNWVAAAFHSGEHYVPKGKSKYSECSTTKSSVLQEFIELQKRKGNYVIVFSTYHSYYKLTDILFDVMIADESQFLVHEKYHNVYSKISANKKICFTATEKWTESDCGLGLNNESVFGPRIYEVKASVLIEKEIIVKPRIHILETSDEDRKNKTLDLCKKIAVYHNKKFNKMLGFSKTLFSMSGSSEIKEVLSCQESFKEFLPNHDIFIIHSREEIKATKNGKEISNRNEFLEEVKESKNCLIFHYDILSEGIDVPGITGVVILRAMNTCKLLQTVGRSLRLYKVKGINKKEYALVTIVAWNKNRDDWVNVQKHLIALRLGGFPLNEEFDISREFVKDTKELFNLKEEQDLCDLISTEEHRKNVQKKLDDAKHLIEKDIEEEELSNIIEQSKKNSKIDIFTLMYEKCVSAGTRI